MARGPFSMLDNLYAVIAWALHIHKQAPSLVPLRVPTRLELLQASRTLAAERSAERARRGL